MAKNKILTINVGSSSLKLAYFEFSSGESDPMLLASSHVDIKGSDLKSLPSTISASISAWTAQGLTVAPDWIAHRVVHGGVQFSSATEISNDVLHKIRALIPLAPLHQPANIAGIEATRELFPMARQVACFDTAFHRDQPWVADTYGLPKEFYDAGIRRYGFHGLSMGYAARQVLQVVPTLATGRVIVAHLGNGASMCALQSGKSIASTMGFSTLDGLAMGTRCGQIDPGVLLHLMTEKGMTAANVSELLYHRAGLLGISEVSSDMRALLESAEPKAKQAVEYFIHRAVLSLGELIAALEGLDGIIFTGGIGENSSLVREMILRKLAWLGIHIDSDVNAAVVTDMARITTSQSKVSSFVLKANEELMMAIEVARLSRSNECVA